MEVVEVSSQEYGSVLRDFSAIYNSPIFNDLNRSRAKDVKYLFFVRGKVRAGLIAGIREQFLDSPFSAPFGGFSYPKNDIGLEDLQLATDALEKYAGKLGLNGIRLTLPPQFYNKPLITKFINTLYVCKFAVSNIDLNHHFDLSLLDENYPDRLWRHARKNLKIALQQGMTFRVCASDEDRKVAYDVIQTNRQTKGYPLRMSCEQVMETGRVVGSHFFLVEFEGSPVAAAVVFQVAPKIVQVIYWGDMPGNSALKPINFLSYRLFEHFKKDGIEIVDIGPSTENSQPNLGLCEFKESIGCLISLKFSFRKLFC
jgi:hypothetical protein